ncbi:pentatricopeptide repeat-containing protein At2g30780 isoform X1 [Amborella trichopoda]|nr:pentatricopeptide repeat-containing protein At2g30780 isoform X1 [Amborella trichopoda]|eukprot:XP_020530817.1 pentatricopeptide repeat-containing protein At2g30780 isoform X1 [Amborella trichopoda]
MAISRGSHSSWGRLLLLVVVWFCKGMRSSPCWKLVNSLIFIKGPTNNLRLLCMGDKGISLISPTSNIEFFLRREIGFGFYGNGGNGDLRCFCMGKEQQQPLSKIVSSNCFGGISSTGLDKQRIGEELSNQIAKVVDELVGGGATDNDAEKLSAILEGQSAILNSPDGTAFIVLLDRLKTWPHLALEVFNWKRKQANSGVQMLYEEYSKGIMYAGRVKNIDLAVELFSEANTRGIKRSTSLYNALMTAYMYNGLIKKSLAVFEDLKREAHCRPTLVTYNILLSIFGRSMLIDHMEMVYKAIFDSNLSPNINSYNTLIAGYVTAWMWDDMERTFKNMEEGPVRPDYCTHLLMLRGYAHARMVEKMEKTYELVRDLVDKKEVALIRAMICAYCKSSDADRVKKIERLIQLLPEEEYRPWIDVLLIRVYAQEDMVEGMEDSIYRAFERNTIVATVSVMRSIISSYFRCNAVDKLEVFIKQAEFAGWRLCRSLYHSKMVMYGSLNRFPEMESVIGEMEAFNFHPTKKTFLILYKSYVKSGQRNDVLRILGAMCKAGFSLPLDALSL